MNKQLKAKLDEYANTLKNKYLKENINKNKRIIFHVDVNSAFLSWTAVKLLKEGYPEDIRTIPSAICHDSASRGSVILAKSYIASNFGVKTGVPLAHALHSFPNLKTFPPDYELFDKCSKEMVNLLKNYTYYVEQYSIDECFLDVSEFLFGKTPENLAKQIKEDIYNTLGFTVNIGIGNSKVMAKTASDFDKPNKINTLYNHELKTKLWPLDISYLFTMGKKSQEKLRKININTIGELAFANFSDISELLGKNGEQLWKYANGIDNSPVHYKKEKAKSISNSQTFSKDIRDKDILSQRIMTITEKVINRLQNEKQICKTVSVEFRTKDFIDFGKSFSFNHYTDLSNEIIDIVKILSEDIYFSFLKNTKNNFTKIKEKNLNPKILEINGEIKPIRLIGIKLSNLMPKESEQNTLFDLVKSKKENYKKKNEAIDNVVNKLKSKYGNTIITRARNIDTKKEDNLLM